jgi:periplasmic protein TonB
MAAIAGRNKGGQEQFGGGLAGAVALHGALAAILLTGAVLQAKRHAKWGEETSSVGAIQASLVSALPLPPKAQPVEKQVLAEDDTSPAPKPPPKEAAAPPPKPTDVLIKGKAPEKTPTKTAPLPTPEPPKHPQPTPPTPKADTGFSATQLAQSLSQVRNGTSAITVEDHTFGVRFAYYIRGMDRVISQSYNQQDVDQRSANGKSVTIRFDIERDGTLSNIHIGNSSGSPSLDAAALRTFQRIDGFGPLPVDRESVEWTLQYHVN